MINTPPNKHCLIIPGRGYSHTSEHSSIYKEKIQRIAHDKIKKPYYGNVEIQVEYLYRNKNERLDGDNLLKTICDALNGVAYFDDSQLIEHRIRTINMNDSFEIKGLPLTQQIADLFSNREAFAIIRLRKVI